MRTLLALVLLTGCFTRHVETRSTPTTLKLRFPDGCTAIVEQHTGAGNYRLVAITDGIADVEVPAMGGGYKERNGKISSVHDPAEYGVVRLRRGDRVLRELSINSTAKLPKADDGRAIVPCD